jgi:hypothetical protein
MTAFGAISYIKNSYAITFKRMREIRRKANEAEDFLHQRFGGHYGQPQVIPVPDSLDPEVPRLIFGSRHGFSQILISQIGITLNVTYSPEWQKEISKGRVYVMERAKALYELLRALGDSDVFFSGITTKAHLPFAGNDQALLALLRRSVEGYPLVDSLYDWQLKVTTVKEERFFSNMTTQNYRHWQLEEADAGLPRLPRGKINENGLEILGDFNDRYAFHENPSYFSSPELVDDLVEKGFFEVEETAKAVQGMLGLE